MLACIWDDEDFRALSENARLMYLFLLSQSDLDQAGVIPLRPPRWARALAVKAPDVGARVAELEATRYVLADEETGELLVRSLMRRDDVWRQPNVFKAGAAAAVACASERLKGALLLEVRRLDLTRANAECRRIAAELLVSLEPFGKGSETVPEGFVKGSRRVPDDFAGGSRAVADSSAEPIANPPGMGKEIGRSLTAGVINHLQVADAGARETDDDGLITQVAELLAERSGRPVTDDESRSVIAVVLARAAKGGNPVHHRPAYVIKAIKAERDVYNLLLADLLNASADVPDWCGECDEYTRQLGRDGDNPARCPNCHPTNVRLA